MGTRVYLAHSREEVVGDLVVERPRQERDELAVVGVVHARLYLRARAPGAFSVRVSCSTNKQQKKHHTPHMATTNKHASLHSVRYTKETARRSAVTANMFGW